MSDFNFKKYRYDIDYVLDHFNLTRGSECTLLQNWLDVPESDSFQLSELLEEKRAKLILEGEGWNEEELKMHFISFVFDAAKLEVANKVKLFFERPLSGIVNGSKVSVVCDAMLATPLGINTPKTPYFFLQVTQRASLVEEFKKGKKTQDDAEGQMLLAMLLATAQNSNGKPVLGCYLQGRFWYFATLYEGNYCVSRAYDATRPNDLTKILGILKRIFVVIPLDFGMRP